MFKIKKLKEGRHIERYKQHDTIFQNAHLQKAEISPKIENQYLYEYAIAL